MSFIGYHINSKVDKTKMSAEMCESAINERREALKEEDPYKELIDECVKLLDAAEQENGPIPNKFLVFNRVVGRSEPTIDELLRFKELLKKYTPQVKTKPAPDEKFIRLRTEATRLKDAEDNKVAVFVAECLDALERPNLVVTKTGVYFSVCFETVTPMPQPKLVKELLNNWLPVKVVSIDCINPQTYEMVYNL